MSVPQDPAPAATVDNSTPKAMTNDGLNGTAPLPAAANSSTLPQETSIPSSSDPTGEFSGDLDTNNELPSQAMLKKVEDTMILDEHNKSRPFKSIYTGPNVARRVLVIFVRHFFCGVSLNKYLPTNKNTKTDAIPRIAKSTSALSPKTSTPRLSSPSQYPRPSPSSAAAQPLSLPTTASAQAAPSLSMPTQPRNYTLRWA